MQNILDKINVKDLNINLDEEYKNALKDEIFKNMTDCLNIGPDKLKNYTSDLEECCLEYKNCLECNGVLNCKNRINGHIYTPRNNNGSLAFQYKRCRYQEKLLKDTEYLKNIEYFSVPSSLKNASMSNINKTDKNRFETIIWINNFVKNYNVNDHQKGLFLHGNFGCGKTYLIAAMFNELAKKGFKSKIVFWPEFLRQAFYDDFKEKYESIKKVPLLLIDDIGAENITAWNRDEILCPLLQYRMDEGLTTFFTSNLNLEQLEEHLSSSKNGVEIVKAGRIISRIKQLTVSMEMISKNLRN